MQLNSDDRPWAPADKPEYLVVLRGQWVPPRDKAMFLSYQQDLFSRLREQADDQEREAANQKLRLDLPEDALAFLPGKLFHDPRTPLYLLNNPAILGSPLHEWKVDMEA